MVSSLLLSMYMLYSFDNTVLATMAILLMCIFNIGGDSKFKNVTNETNNQEVLVLTSTWFSGTIIIYTLFLILNIGYYFIWEEFVLLIAALLHGSVLIPIILNYFMLRVKLESNQHLPITKKREGLLYQSIKRLTVTTTLIIVTSIVSSFTLDYIPIVSIVSLAISGVVGLVYIERMILNSPSVPKRTMRATNMVSLINITGWICYMLFIG